MGPYVAIPFYIICQVKLKCFQFLKLTATSPLLDCHLYGGWCRLPPERCGGQVLTTTTTRRVCCGGVGWWVRHQLPCHTNFVFGWSWILTTISLKAENVCVSLCVSLSAFARQLSHTNRALVLLNLQTLVGFTSPWLKYKDILFMNWKQLNYLPDKHVYCIAIGFLHKTN
jgi:hypothetical protein